MVYLFIIQTLNPTKPDVLYNQNFGCPLAGDQQNDDDSDRISSRNARIISRLQEEVCHRVVSEYHFAVQVSKRNFENDMDQLRQDGTMPSFPTGAFVAPNVIAGLDWTIKLTDGNPVLWLGAGTVAFVMVLSSSENLGLGVITLTQIARHLQEYVQAITSPKEVLLRADRVMLVLEHLLPLGQMVFLNSNMQAQLEKDLQQTMFRSRQR